MLKLTVLAETLRRTDVVQTLRCEAEQGLRRYWDTGLAVMRVDRHGTHLVVTVAELEASPQTLAGSVFLLSHEMLHIMFGSHD